METLKCETLKKDDDPSKKNKITGKMKWLFVFLGAFIFLNPVVKFISLNCLCGGCCAGCFGDCNVVIGFPFPYLVFGNNIFTGDVFMFMFPLLAIDALVWFILVVLAYRKKIKILIAILVIFSGFLLLVGLPRVLDSIKRMPEKECENKGGLWTNCPEAYADDVVLWRIDSIDNKKPYYLDVSKEEEKGECGGKYSCVLNEKAKEAEKNKIKPFNLNYEYIACYPDKKYFSKIMNIGFCYPEKDSFGVKVVIEESGNKIYLKASAMSFLEILVKDKSDGIENIVREKYNLSDLRVFDVNERHEDFDPATGELINKEMLVKQQNHEEFCEVLVNYSTFSKAGLKKVEGENCPVTDKRELFWIYEDSDKYIDIMVGSDGKDSMGLSAGSGAWYSTIKFLDWF